MSLFTEERSIGSSCSTSSEPTWRLFLMTWEVISARRPNGRSWRSRPAGVSGLQLGFLQRWCCPWQQGEPSNLIAAAQWNSQWKHQCRCQNRRISSRGSRTVRLRLMVTGGGGHDVYPGSGPLYGGNTLLPAWLILMIWVLQELIYHKIVMSKP